MDGKQVVKYNKGVYKKVAFVFSCPGREEEEKNKVLSGKTGDNLNEVLKVLMELDGELFPTMDRYKYTITNSSEIIHYEKKDNRTQPKKSEIKEKNNIKRLKRELKDAEYIIAFGEMAQFAMQVMTVSNKKQHIINNIHLSNRNINVIIKIDKRGQIIEKANKKNKGSIKQQQINNRKRRLEKIANEILEELKNGKGYKKNQ